MDPKGSMLGKPKPLEAAKAVFFIFRKEENIMRTKNKEVHLRLTESEMEKLRSMAEKAGVSLQTFIYYAVFSIKLKEKPPKEFHDVLKELRQINNNMNQVAAKANSMSFIDTAKYWANVSELQRVIGKLMEDAYS